MKELFYFSTSDLMIRVTKTSAATATYQSHRPMNENESLTVSRYLNETLTSENAEWAIVQFDYQGVDVTLVNDKQNYDRNKRMSTAFKSHPQEHMTGPGQHPYYDNLSDVPRKEVDESVGQLIAESMTNYYFEKIGETVVQIREMVDAHIIDNGRDDMLTDLAELVRSYNTHVDHDRKVTVFDVVPQDLHQVLELEQLKM